MITKLIFSINFIINSKNILDKLHKFFILNIHFLISYFLLSKDEIFVLF